MLTIPTRWQMLLVLFLARTSMAYQFQTVPSAGPYLIDSLALGFTQLGTLIGLYMLPGIVLALPGGLLARWLGAERMALSGLALMVVGGTMMGADSVLPVFAGRVVSGLGAVFVNVLMTKMVTDWFADQDIVPAMAVFVASWPLGLALGLMTFPPLAALYGVPVVMYVAAAVVAIALVLVATVYRPRPGVPLERKGHLELNLSRHEWVLISLAGLIWGSFNAAYVILISFLPDQFVLRGYSLIEAAWAVSLLAWVVIVSVPLAGYIAERVQRPNLLMLGGFTVTAAATALLPIVGVPALPFAVILVASGVPAGLIMALPAQAVRAQNRSVGMGVFYTWHFAAMAILPSLAGSARDAASSAAAPIFFAAAMIALAAIALLGFRLVQRRATALVRQSG
jgi:cyanate permease